jgi:hypothetical protein
MLPEPMHRVPAKRQTPGIAKRDEAGAIALRETGGDQVEAALLREQAWSGARSLLESNRTWRQVERVAAALQQVRTVDGDDVRKLRSLAN